MAKQALTARVLTEADAQACVELWNASSRRLPQHPDLSAHACLPDQLIRVGVFDSDRLALAVTFAKLQRKGLRYWNSPFFTSFSGLLVSAEDESLSGTQRERRWRDLLSALAPALKGVADRVEIICQPGVDDLRALQWAGWSLRPHYNYLTEWSEPDGWRGHLEATVRRQERKAGRSGLNAAAVPASNTSELRELWKRNAAKQGLDAVLAENLKRLGDWLHAEDRGLGIVVRDDEGRAHAAGLFGHDDGRVYYLAGASDPELLGSGGPTRLHTAALEEIDRRGLPRCYDWVGANTPNIARFKRHFGPRLETLLSARLESRRYAVVDAAKRVLR